MRTEHPDGYGRIVRASGGRVLRIVEQKDANARELELTECNTGVLAAPAALLRRWLARSATPTRRASTTSPMSSPWR